MGTTDRWLSQFSTITKAVYKDLLRLHKKDYDGFVPPEIEALRKLKEKVAEHDGLFIGLFRQMTASFGGMMRLDEKLKGKK